jgi:hypothetical protein
MPPVLARVILEGNAIVGPSSITLDDGHRSVVDCAALREFFQANPSLDRSAGGLGIALSVTKRMVELHGGSFRIDEIQVWLAI